MSLINDALKRAKQAQPSGTPPPAPHLNYRPVEADQTVRHGVGVMLPAALVLIALLVLLLVWVIAKRNDASNSATANLQSQVVARAAAPPPPPAPAANPPPPAAPEASQPAAPPEPPSPQEAAAVDATFKEPQTAPEPPAPAAPPKPAPLRLQGIVYNPSQPSAMINGKTVFSGDKVGEFRVAAITQTSITLTNGDQTNTLVLGE